MSVCVFLASVGTSKTIGVTLSTTYTGESICTQFARFDHKPAMDGAAYGQGNSQG